MRYDPVNDHKVGNILATDKMPIEPRSSGVQIKVICCRLLEGHAPRASFASIPPKWKVGPLPHEEQFHRRE